MQSALHQFGTYLYSNYDKGRFMRIRTSHPWALSRTRSSYTDRVEPIASSRALVLADARPFYNDGASDNDRSTRDADYVGISHLAAQMLASDYASTGFSTLEAQPYSKATIAYQSVAALPQAQSLGFSRSL